jgi:6-phosphofructokinase 1
MAARLKGKACVGQSGGPTAVINQTLVGIIEEARRHKEITKLLGARHGTKGILKGEFVDLLRVPAGRLAAIAATPAAALGSVRHMPTDPECADMVAFFKREGVRYFFYIGGDDSAQSALTIARMAADARHEMRVIHVPKTIDNNLEENDHTPGFGSAARFVAAAVRGDDLDNRSLPGIKVDIIMGRDAGWLTASAALARRRDGDGPHLLYLPEVPFTVEKFLADVHEMHERYGRCLVCASEGIRDPEGALWAKIVGQRLADGLKDKAKDLFGKPQLDPFGHYQLSGTGILADFLTGRVKDGLSVSRVRGDTFGYLQRSFPGFASPVDAREARRVGREAVRYAGRGRDGSVAIRRQPGRTYGIRLQRVDLDLVAGKNRQVPKAFIAPSSRDVRPAFLDYVRPLTGRLPETALLG